MIEILLIGFGLWNGVSPLRLAVLAGAIVFPVPAAALLAVGWWRSRSPRGPDASQFCEAVASEMRAGASPRQAIAAGARSVGAVSVAEAAVGNQPLRDVAEIAGREFPEVGPELGICIERASWLGSPMADLLDEVASVALAQLDAARELRSAMAPARATVLVLVAGPAVAIWWAVGRGGLETYLSSPAQRVVVGVGGCLCLGALVVGSLMMRRSR